jgi:galactokinase
MDQLASVAGVDGCALLIDCHTLAIEPIVVPDVVDVVVVHSGQQRVLAATAYAARRAQCEAAEASIGPLRLAGPTDVDALDEPLRRRARHVVTENARVRSFAAALRAGDGAGAGALMVESHRSLRDDFEVSTTVLDDLVAHLCGRPGVLGARLTGAGFGGCVVALCERGASVVGLTAQQQVWRVRPSAGARIEVGQASA